LVMYPGFLAGVARSSASASSSRRSGPWLASAPPPTACRSHTVSTTTQLIPYLEQIPRAALLCLFRQRIRIAEAGPVHQGFASETWCGEAPERQRSSRWLYIMVQGKRIPITAVSWRQRQHNHIAVMARYKSYGRSLEIGRHTKPAMVLLF
jgi:hypothetical protein